MRARQLHHGNGIPHRLVEAIKRAIAPRLTGWQQMGNASANHPNAEMCSGEGSTGIFKRKEMGNGHFLWACFGFVREKPYFYEACCDQAEEISLNDNLLQKEVIGTTVSKQFS